MIIIIIIFLHHHHVSSSSSLSSLLLYHVGTAAPFCPLTWAVLPRSAFKKLRKNFLESNHWHMRHPGPQNFVYGTEFIT
jgi:hypothetical protein